MGSSRNTRFKPFGNIDGSFFRTLAGAFMNPPPLSISFDATGRRWNTVPTAWGTAREGRADDKPQRKRRIVPREATTSVTVLPDTRRKAVRETRGEAHVHSPPKSRSVAVTSG